MNTQELEKKFNLAYEDLKAVTAYKCLKCNRYYLEKEFARRCCDNINIRINHRLDLRGEYGRTTEPMLGERLFAKVHYKKQYNRHQYHTRYEEKNPFSGICAGTRMLALKQPNGKTKKHKFFLVAVSMNLFRYVLLEDLLKTD